MAARRICPTGTAAARGNAFLHDSGRGSLSQFTQDQASEEGLFGCGGGIQQICELLPAFGLGPRTRQARHFCEGAIDSLQGKLRLVLPGAVDAGEQGVSDADLALRELSTQVGDDERD